MADPIITKGLVEHWLRVEGWQMFNVPFSDGEVRPAWLMGARFIQPSDIEVWVSTGCNNTGMFYGEELLSLAFCAAAEDLLAEANEIAKLGGTPSCVSSDPATERHIKKCAAMFFAKAGINRVRWEDARSTSDQTAARSP